MNKQILYKIMPLILMFIFTRFIHVRCISTNLDEQYIDFHSNILLFKPEEINKEINFHEIKEQFKNVDNDINELKEQINIEIIARQKRAVPRKNDQQDCIVSKRELSDLKSVIDSAMTNLSKSKAINCNFDSNKNNNCNELLKLIQCGINNIQNEYNQVATDKGSSKEYQNLVNAYQMLHEKYLKIKDDIKSLSDQKYKQRMDKLTSDMQIVAKQLKESNDIIVAKTIDLCAAHIVNGNIDNSIKEYHSLMENDKKVGLPKIVQNVYISTKNENKENYIKKLLSFIEKIPQKCDQFLTYLSLISKMQEENHINCYLSSFWNTLKISSTKWNSQKLVGKITECPKSYMEDFINIQLQRIITHIYANCFPSAETAIQYIDELLTNDQKVIAYPILFREMKKRNGLNGYEIVLLGFRIQEIMMTQKSENLNAIMQLKDELPSGVNVLMSAGAIRLKNKAFSNSHFALYNMKTSACTESVDQYQDWFVRVHQRGRYFQFLNIANAHSLRTDETKTFVTTGYCDRHLWEIIPISNGASFYIKNKYYGNILGVNLSSKLITTNSNYVCHEVRVFKQYTGDDFQKWEIKHKI